MTRTLRDHRADIWTVTYDRSADTEWVTRGGSSEGDTLVRVDYSKGLAPLRWSSGGEGLLNCSNELNQLGQLTKRQCQRGLVQSFGYNGRTGRMTSFKDCQRSPVQYLFTSQQVWPLNQFFSVAILFRTH